jgi:hypothetical protein
MLQDAKKKVVAMLNVMRKAEDVVAKDFDQNGFTIVLMGNDLPMRWKDISDEDLARLSLAALDTNVEGLFHAGALAAAAGLGSLCDKVSERLTTLAPDKARELDRLAGK